MLFKAMILQMHTHGGICIKVNSSTELMGMTYNSSNLYVQLATEFGPHPYKSYRWPNIFLTNYWYCKYSILENTDADLKREDGDCETVTTLDAETYNANKGLNCT